VEAPKLGGVRRHPQHRDSPLRRPRRRRPSARHRNRSRPPSARDAEPDPRGTGTALSDEPKQGVKHQPSFHGTSKRAGRHHDHPSTRRVLADWMRLSLRFQGQPAYGDLPRIGAVAGRAATLRPVAASTAHALGCPRERTTVPIRSEAVRAAWRSSHNVQHRGKRKHQAPSRNSRSRAVRNSYQSIGGEGPDSRSALTKGIKRIEKLHNPTEFPSRNLRPNQWVKFDLDMAQAAVHEDCATAPADNYIRPGHDLCEGFA
jgi:hypothetical protein